MESLSQQDQEWRSWYNGILQKQDDSRALELLSSCPFGSIRVTQPAHFTGYSRAPDAHRRLISIEGELMKIACDIKARIQRGGDKGHSVSAAIHRVATPGYHRALDVLAGGLSIILTEIASVTDGHQASQVRIDKALDYGEEALACADRAERLSAVPILAWRRGLAKKILSRGSRGGSRRRSSHRHGSSRR